MRLAALLLLLLVLVVHCASPPPLETNDPIMTRQCRLDLFSWLNSCVYSKASDERLCERKSNTYLSNCMPKTLPVVPKYLT